MEPNWLIDLLKMLAIVIGLVVAGINIYKFFWKAPSEREGSMAENHAVNTTVDVTVNIAARFVNLFNSHGVHRHQIPTFFDHGLSIHTCATDDELLKHITPEMLSDAAELFGVSLDWLQGASTEIYEVPDFYKYPEKFNEYLVNLKTKRPAADFHAYALIGKNKKFGQDKHDGLIIITEIIGEINERPIYRYHLSGKWIVSYWKCRGCFTACCALLFKQRIYPVGIYVEGEWLSKVIDGHCLLEYNYVDMGGMVNVPGKGRWAVNELIEIPKTFIDGVRAEHNNFGLKSALSLWLELSDYMDIEDGSHQQVKTTFQRELESID